MRLRQQRTNAVRKQVAENALTPRVATDDTLYMTLNSPTSPSPYSGSASSGPMRSTNRSRARAAPQAETDDTLCMTLDAPNSDTHRPKPYCGSASSGPMRSANRSLSARCTSGGAWPHAIRRVSCAKNAGRCRRNASASSAASARSVATCGSG